MAVIRRVIKSICLFSIMIHFLCSRPLLEKEPENNTRKQAMKMEPGQVVSGSYYSPTGTDIDYMYVSVLSPSLISGNLSAVKGIDPEILFYRKGEAKPYKIINDNKSSLNERFGPMLIESPGVVIEVRPNSPANDVKYKNLKYEFRYEISLPQLPVESESNDTLEQANTLTENVIRGYYNNALSNNELERDYYSVEFPEEKKYRFGLSLSGVNNIDAVLRLYSKDGGKLMTVDDGGVGEGENIFSYGIQGPGKLFFSVNAKDYKISDSQFYEIKASMDEYDEKFELEPNDNIFQSTMIKTQKIYSDFSNEHDVDFYKYFNESLETKQFYAEVIPDSKYDIKLELYSGINSKPVVFDDGGENLAEGIANWTVSPLETIYLKVSNNNRGKTRSYTLITEIHTLEGEYEKEPNDTIRRATPLFPAKTLTGFINPRTDLDYYVIKIANQARYQVVLESPPECSLSASILDTKGIKTEGRNATRVGESLTFDAILEPNGFIMASCEKTNKSQYRDSYKLSINTGQ